MALSNRNVHTTMVLAIPDPLESERAAVSNTRAFASWMISFTNSRWEVIASARRKAPENFLDCGARGDFSLALAADAISQGKQPAAGSGVLGRPWQHIAQVVLVARTNATRIRELRKLNVQHEYAKSRQSHRRFPLNQIGAYAPYSPRGRNFRQPRRATFLRGDYAKDPSQRWIDRAPSTKCSRRRSLRKNG